MNILITVLLVIAFLIAVVLLIALFTKKGYNIQSKIIINAPVQNVFNYIRLIKNWDSFNERATADPSRKNEFKGTDGTVGFISAWSGNKRVGEGEKEIKFISEEKKIETEIRFVKPFAVTGYINISTESVSGNQTKVTMSNASTLKYPLNFLLLFVEKGIAKDMDVSLLKLKSILEQSN